MKIPALLLVTALLVGCSSTAVEPAAINDSSGDVADGDGVSECATNPTPEDVLEVTVVTNSGPHAAPYIMWADQIGCFEENGLTVTLVQAGAPSDRLAALVSGSADIIWLPTDPLLAATVNGDIDMVLVAPHVGFSEERLTEAKAAREFSGSLLLDGILLAAPGSALESLANLEGATIGRQSAVSNIGVNLALEEAGVDLDSIQWVDIE
jgi:ABC-type nitrate/sulfonate/bicarbonate transport system substrate-binding protein